MTSSLLFVDSFDDYTDPTQRWVTAGGFVISTAVVRTGIQSFKCDGNNTNSTAQQNFTSRATYIVGFAYYVNTSPGAEQALLSFMDGGSQQVTFTLDGTGNIRARRGSTGGTLLGTASSIFPFSAWHYLEFKVTINSSTGVIGIWLDGVSVLSLTGQNTQSTGNANAGGVQLREACFQYVDDFYILDPTIGGAYSAPLGDVKMLCSMPSANGTTNNYTNVFASWPSATAVKVGQTIKDSNGNVQRVQSISGTGTTGGSAPTWATTGGVTTTDNPGGNQVVWVVIGTGSNPGAANWMAVNEIPPDDNSSYVTDATPGDIDRYVFPSIAGSAVKAVVVNMRAEKDDAGTRTIRAACKSGGTTADSGTDLALALNSYADYEGIFEVDPNTGVAWTVSAVNAAEFGVKTTN